MAVKEIIDAVKAVIRNTKRKKEINFQYPTGWKVDEYIHSQIQMIVDYYSTRSKDRYVYSRQHSYIENMVVLIKEDDVYQRLTLEQQENPTMIDVKHTDFLGRYKVWESYILTGNVPRYWRSVREINFNGWIQTVSFYEDSLELIYQYGGDSKEETCRNIRNILTSANDSRTRLTVRNTFCSLKVLSEESYEDQIVDIGLRMLEPRELYGCQGFPDDYIIERDYTGKKYPRSEQVRRCGNAVCPPIPAALVRANLPELCKGDLGTLERGVM